MDSEQIARRIQNRVTSWPEIDRAAWERALSRPRWPRERQGKQARKPKPYTLFAYTDAYAHSIAWLRRRGLLDDRAPAGARWSPDLLVEFAKCLEAGARDERGLSSTTINMRLVGLGRVLSTIDPNWDPEFLNALARRYPTSGDPSKKAERLAKASPPRLLDVGMRLMQRADSNQNGNMFRTGLQIAMLARHPLRLADFAALEVGKHLQSIAGAYFLSGLASKTEKPFDLRLPEDLVPAMDRYLGTWRPILLKGVYKGARAPGAALWITSRGASQDRGSIYKSIVAATMAELGEPISPHLFRDCLATYVAECDPAAWEAAHQILGNTAATAQKHYTHGGADEAARVLSRLLSQCSSSAV